MFNLHKMKSKLLKELEKFEIENLSLYGGQSVAGGSGATEDCATCDSNTKKSELPGDDDCDVDADPPLAVSGGAKTKGIAISFPSYSY